MFWRHFLDGADEADLVGGVEADGEKVGADFVAAGDGFVGEAAGVVLEADAAVDEVGAVGGVVSHMEQDGGVVGDFGVIDAIGLQADGWGGVGGGGG